MPRTAITAQRIDVAGTTPATEPANVDGNSVAFGATRTLVVKNGSAAAINATVVTARTVEGLAVPNRVIAVAAGTDKFIRLSTISVQTTGLVHVDYSAVATVTVLVLEV